MNSNIENLEEAALVAEAWERGILAHLLRPYQYTVYEVIWTLIERLKFSPTAEDDYRVGVVVASRKIGKSFLETLVAHEFCLRYPGAIVRIAAPTAVEARDIFLPEFSKLHATCPPSLRPKPKGVDGHWHFPNGSTIVMKGVDMKPDRLRGPSSDLNLVDEASYVNRLKYLVNTVMMPMTINTRGPTILNSTLNQSPNSEFNEYFDRCEPIGQAAVIDVYSAGFTPQQIAAERNAVDIDTWQVEYECKRQRTASMTVVPEWTAEAKAALVVEAPTLEAYQKRPELAYWTRFTSVDFGTVDNTVILTGYYDFAESCVYITQEGLLRGAAVTPNAIGGLMRELENADDEDRPMHNLCRRRRTGDHNIELLQGLQIDQHLPISIVHKLGVETMVNLFRVYVQQGRVKIHPRCDNLLMCLDKAAWTEQAATRRDGPRVRTLSRSSLTDSKKQPLGHFDALMTAVYMVLTVDSQKHRNPLPQMFVPEPVAAKYGTYSRDRYGAIHVPNNQPSVARPAPAAKLPAMAALFTKAQRPRR